MRSGSDCWCPLLVVLFVVGLTQAQDDVVVPEKVTGVMGQTVMISCTLPGQDSAPDSLEWRDNVYNLNRDKVLIGTRTGDDIQYNDQHFRAGNYVIYTNGSLLIESLVDTDPGRYICRSKLGDPAGQWTVKEYELVIISMPKCEGEGELEEQMETTLSCLVETQGSLDGSAVDWYANDVKVDVEDVKDDSSIGKLFKVLDLVATPSMDQVTYTCRTNVGSFVQECSIFLDVKYLVREVNIDPHVDELKVGQLVNCSTKGNPLPDLSWDPLPPRDSIVPTIGSQPWIAFTIPQAWEGMTKSFVCKASNAYGSRSEKAEETVSFKIHSETTEKEETVPFVLQTKPPPVNKPSTEEEKTPEESEENTGGDGGSGGDKEAATEGSSVAGIAAGFIIGALVLVVIIIAVICIRKKQSKKPKGAKPVPGQDDDMRRIDMDGKGGNCPPVELTKVEKQPATNNQRQLVPPVTTITSTPYDVETPPCDHADHVSEKDNLLADDDLDFQLNTESDMGLELNGFEGFGTNFTTDSTLPVRGSVVMEEQDKPDRTKDIFSSEDHNSQPDTLPLNGL